MTIVGVTAVRGSPGATSLAVGMGAAWTNLAGDALVVEADPAGGILRLRFDLPGNPSWVSLSADLRRNRNAGVVMGNTVDLDGSRCLTVPFDPLVAGSVLRRSAAATAELLTEVGPPVVLDLGRLDRTSPSLPLAAAADTVLVVFRPRLDEIQSALYTVRLVRSLGVNAALVTVGDQPHHPSEVADLAGVALAAALPDDPTMAVAFSGGRYHRPRLRRSTLWRSIMSLAEASLQRTVSPPTADPSDDATTTGESGHAPAPILATRSNPSDPASDPGSDAASDAPPPAPAPAEPGAHSASPLIWPPPDEADLVARSADRTNGVGADLELTSGPGRSER